jgi:hypothetical protein
MVKICMEAGRNIKWWLPGAEAIPGLSNQCYKAYNNVSGAIGAKSELI